MWYGEMPVRSRFLPVGLTALCAAPNHTGRGLFGRSITDAENESRESLTRLVLECKSI